jgi:hypothetical protein
MADQHYQPYDSAGNKYGELKPTPEPDQTLELREILLGVRDWGEGLAHQADDGDPLPGISPTRRTGANTSMGR